MNDLPNLNQLSSTPEVDAIITNVVNGIHTALGPKLLGTYVYGSLVTGDFDLHLSDIDLLAILAADTDQREFDELHYLHERTVQQYPKWQDRVETHYISLDALRNIHAQSHQMLVISPGEPLERINVRTYYLVNYYVAREQGIAVFGPAPHSLIPPISAAEFKAIMRYFLENWPVWVRENGMRRPVLAYAIVTVSRAAYSLRTGEQTSKPRAAQWMRDQMPQFAALIDDALRWRDAGRDDASDDQAAYEATVQFVDAVAAHASWEA